MSGMQYCYVAVVDGEVVFGSPHKYRLKYWINTYWNKYAPNCKLYGCKGKHIRDLTNDKYFDDAKKASVNKSP